MTVYNGVISLFQIKILMCLFFTSTFLFTLIFPVLSTLYVENISYFALHSQAKILSFCSYSKLLFFFFFSRRHIQVFEHALLLLSSDIFSSFTLPPLFHIIFFPTLLLRFPLLSLISSPSLLLSLSLALAVLWLQIPTGLAVEIEGRNLLNHLLLLER